VSQFEYVAVLVSIIVGLALTQILRGVGRMATTKDGPRTYWVHLVWTLYFFLYITFFWWWEFQLDSLEWNLALYFVVIIYATLLFFATLILQPGNVDGFSSYKEYYYSSRRWFFSLTIALLIWDTVDTLTKGTDHIVEMGDVWLFGHIGQAAASAVAIVTANETFHKINALVWILLLIVNVTSAFNVIG
jgi:hypothetical protein